MFCVKSPRYLLLVALAGQHHELHGVGDVGVCVTDTRLRRPSLLQLALQLQRDGHVQLVHLHRLATSLLREQNATNVSELQQQTAGQPIPVDERSYLQILQHHLIQSLDEVFVFSARHVLQPSTSDGHLLYAHKVLF